MSRSGVHEKKNEAGGKADREWKEEAWKEMKIKTENGK